MYARTSFFADLSNYIPVGSRFHQPNAHVSQGSYGDDFKEAEYLPIDFNNIRFSKQSQKLVKWQWIKLFTRKQHDGTIHTRVYVLPDDVGRKYVERNDKSLRPILIELIRSLDCTTSSWDGHYNGESSRYELGSKSSDSLFYIFNRLPSPIIEGSELSCPYSRDAIDSIFESDAPPGLRTSLYPYQRRTVATMIRREVEPKRALDPRLQPLTGPCGTVFYLDIEAGVLLRHKREYDEACGGVLGESMGLGKTLICLATILATKGHWPSIPPEYSLDLHPIRPSVASLMQTAAAAVAQARIPWKSAVQEMITAGEDPSNFRALLEENVPCYTIPILGSNRKMRRSSTVAKGKQIKLCSATLIIVPQNLLSHWNAEICHHLVPGELKVICLDTSHTDPMPSTNDLQQYDIVLMSRQRLEREMITAPTNKSTRVPGCFCLHDAEWLCRTCKEKAEYQSPLKDLHFLRVIMDEGHEFSSYGSRNNTYWALQQLHVQRKWIVSGTPASGLIGVEVGAAASETSDPAVAGSCETNTDILARRRKESAISQERKDLEKLGGLVVGFLRLKPWSNTKGEDQATWSKYIMPPEDGKRKPMSLQTLLQSLVVRHRIEDIEADLKLPPLYNRVVYLEPSWYDKLSINLFALALVVNFITSERTDEDYMFHAKNRRFLHSLITNLRQANFYWTSWAPQEVAKTIQAARAYREDHSLPNSSCPVNDHQLLEQAIHLGETILTCKSWQVLAQVHEMGVFVESFPEEARNEWTLTEREGLEPLLSGATQMIKAQEWVDTHMHLSDVIHALSGIGAKTMRKLWSHEEAMDENRAAVSGPTSPLRRRAQLAGPPGIPKLTQKQTVSRVKAATSPRKSKGSRSALEAALEDGALRGLGPASMPSSADSAGLGAPTLLPNSPLAKVKIIGTASTKLSYLLDQLVSLHTTEKILVFYEGDHIAYYIAQALELLSIRHLIYTGTLTPARQSAYVTTFNTTPTFRVMLMDVHQAAHGLHIASASRVFFVNPVWQPNVEAQAIKRAHRIGQTKPVHVETLVLRNTLEDQMLQRRKGMTAQEHQKAEKSLLDDDTMSTIIKAASFIPLSEEEMQNPRSQIATLQTPQQLFGRPNRPTGDVADPDADLIFPNGSTPTKSNNKKQQREPTRKKRKSGAEHAPELSDSPPRTPRRAMGEGSMMTSSPSRTAVESNSMPDRPAEHPAGLSGSSSVSTALADNLTMPSASLGLREVAGDPVAASLFGGPIPLP